MKKQILRDIFVNNEDELNSLIVNKQLTNRKTYIHFKCKKCNIDCSKQYRKERQFRLLCKDHSIEETCIKHFGSTNPFTCKEIQKHAHNTIHQHAEARQQIKLAEQQKIKEIKQQKKENDIINEYGSINNYNYYNSLSSAYEKTKFREIINYGSHENAQKIKVQHTKEHNLEKYGVEWSSQRLDVISSIMESNLEKYGVKHYYQSEEFKEKSRQTKITRYNNPNYRNDNQIFKTCLETYGSITPLANNNIKNKIKQTNIERYGVDNPWKTKECQDKCRQKYYYDNYTFDSSPEIAFYIWLKDNNINFEYQPDCQFWYSYNNKKYRYYPDFKIENEYYEIKGDQFLKDDGTWQNPFDTSQNDKYEEKHKFLIENNIKILYSVDYQKYLTYVCEKYGNNYLKQFKNTKKVK